LAVARGTTSEPGKTLIADIPDVSVSLHDEIAGDVGGTPDIIRENAVVL
jgi:hypothetical protein